MLYTEAFNEIHGPTFEIRNNDDDDESSLHIILLPEIPCSIISGRLNLKTLCNPSIVIVNGVAFVFNGCIQTPGRLFLMKSAGNVKDCWKADQWEEDLTRRS